MARCGADERTPKLVVVAVDVELFAGLGGAGEGKGWKIAEDVLKEFGGKGEEGGGCGCRRRIGHGGGDGGVRCAG